MFKSSFAKYLSAFVIIIFTSFIILSGIITAFMAQGADPFKSAVMGAYVHGLSGEKAEKVLTSRCVTASEIIEYLPEVFKEC